MTNKKRKIRKGQFGLQTPEQIFQSNIAFNGSNIGSVTRAANPGLTYNFANDPAIIEQLNKNYAEFDKLAIDNSVVQMSNPNGGTSLVKADLNKFLNSALTRNTISPTSPSSIVNSKLTKDLTGSLTSVIGNSSPYQAAIKAADKTKKITGLFGKAGGLSKASNILNKGILKGSGISIGAAANGALNLADAFIPKAEDKASKITSGVFNGLSTVASFVPGIGTLASVALKGLGSLFGAGVKSVKGNTANELVDTSSSYTGEDALASKKFGLLGLRGAKKYAGLVAQRQINRDLAADVLQEGKDDLLAANNVQQYQMRDTLSKNGDDWMYTLRAKQGAKIKEVKRLSSLYNKRLISKEPLKEGTTVEFKNGGSINVIPEGALHARKNNLTEINPELEGITKKGIPVISKEEGGEMIQHAEIERSEIIFNLETTKKLESLREQYNKSEDKSEKDNLAIEAGKLLAQQIMENTIDNTGELLK